MPENKVHTAIGLMSGTSLDGVDCALIETDGRGVVRPLAFMGIPYISDDRNIIRAAFGIKDRNADIVKKAEEIVTKEHIRAVKELLLEHDLPVNKVDVIGFHGQTIFHAPHENLTIQIGDGARMAKETGIDVVADFRTADVQAGGQGAPLAPVYHAARIKSARIPLPCVVLNIGGVANITWIGESENDLLAFDCGPGNALMDDWVLSRTGKRFDEDGKLAAAGKPIERFLNEWINHEYFTRIPPKSLDRDAWDIAAMGRVTKEMGDVSIEDGAATLMEFTVQGICRSLEHLPAIPQNFYVCGGGRHNKALMATLAKRLYSHVKSVDELGWDGDATEAECFAYLAVRSLLGRPLSFPRTTGVPNPQNGGVFYPKE